MTFTELKLNKWYETNHDNGKYYITNKIIIDSSFYGDGYTYLPSSNINAIYELPFFSNEFFIELNENEQNKYNKLLKKWKAKFL